MVELIEFKFGRGSIDAFVLSKYPNISDRNKRIIKLLQGSTELDFIDVSVQSYLDPVELALWLNTKTASISSKLTKCQMSYQNGSNEWIRLRACTNVQQNTSFIFELASIEYARQVLQLIASLDLMILYWMGTLSDHTYSGIFLYLDQRQNYKA